MTLSPSSVRIGPTPVSINQDLAAASGARMREVCGRLGLWLARPLHAWRRKADDAQAYEQIDGTVLGCDGFWASESMGLDGAPAMVFRNAMPPYLRDIDRPARRCD